MYVDFDYFKYITYNAHSALPIRLAALSSFEAHHHSSHYRLIFSRFLNPRQTVTVVVVVGTQLLLLGAWVSGCPAFLCLFPGRSHCQRRSAPGASRSSIFCGIRRADLRTITYAALQQTRRTEPADWPVQPAAVRSAPDHRAALMMRWHRFVFRFNC